MTEFRPQIAHRAGGTPRAPSWGVTHVRATLTALLLLVAMMATTASAFVTPRHTECVTQKHECEHVPSIAGCCCHKADAGRPDSAPPEPRMAVGAPAVLATPVVQSLLASAPTVATLTRPSTISPRFADLDLTTLFATLLI